MNCKVPTCFRTACRTWALVPICGECYDDIRSETVRAYYKKKISYDQREKYLQIAGQIPWARKETTPL